MSVKDFQNFILTDPLLSSNVNVVKTVRLPNIGPKVAAGNRVALVLDAESCLDRLYGGYYPDWSCGGQWRHMVTFLSTIFGQLHHSNVQVAVFLNGALEASRFKDWVKVQKQNQSRAKQVLRHVAKRGTPPPKAFWIPPCTLHTMLRLALRSLNVIVINSTEDHLQELMGFCWENGYHGVMSDNGEVALFNPPSYLSAHSIKLSLRLEVSTLEVNLEEVAKCLELDPSRFSLLATLLGNHILPPQDLSLFHQRLTGTAKHHVNDVVRSVVNYVQALGSVDDHGQIAKEVFGSESDPRSDLIVKSIKYYIQGSREGYSRHSRNGKTQKKDKRGKAWALGRVITKGTISEGKGDAGQRLNEEHGAEIAERIALGLEKLDLEEVVAKADLAKVEDDRPIRIPECAMEIRKTAAERHRLGQMSPYVSQLISRGEIKLPALLEGDNSSDFPRVHDIYRPLRQNVYAVLFNLHHAHYTRRQLGFSSGSCQKTAEDLSGKAKDGDESSKRDAKMEGSINYCVHEWQPYNGYERPLPVSPVEVKWPVPTVQRLWFGSTVEDKQKRLHAFMSCLRCDDAHKAFLQPGFPQPLLLMACVLRYLISVNTKEPLIRKPELDAFLVTAFSPELRDDQYLDALSLELVTIRGVKLALLFMQGIEMALFANDACGAPIPFQMCLPWTFFDGKLFHANLLRVAKARNLIDLCGGRLDIASQVERLRHAIMGGLVSPVVLAPAVFCPGRPFLHRPHPMMMKKSQHKQKNKKKKSINNKKLSEEGNEK